MPPKKKVKEPETAQIQQPVAQLFKIPKKPLYRSVHLDPDIHEKRIQIRLWKINSLKTKILPAGVRRYDLSYLPANLKKVSRTLARFSNRYRVLKNLRILNYEISSYKEGLTNKLVSRSWRLEKLLIYCSESYITTKPFITKFLNPHLKDFFLRMYHFDKKEVEKAINGLKCLVNCNFWWQQSLCLNTKSMRSFAGYLNGSPKNQVIPSIKGISQDIPLKQDTFDLTLKEQSQFPHLKTLQVDYSVSYDMVKSHPTLDFIRKYPQLTSLSISTHGKDVPSFEFLSSLSNLKQLTIDNRDRSHYWVPLDSRHHYLKTLPLIHSLEKLKISRFYPWNFSSENLQDFLASNKNLKHLQVHFFLQDDLIIFHNNIVLPLETLKLTTETVKEAKRKAATGKLASFLNKHKYLKSLEIRIDDSLFMSEYEGLLRGLTSMTCLEHLTWDCAVPNELQDNKLKDLKKTLIQNPQIQKLELGFGRNILTAKDFSSLLDGLLRLENLKHFILKGNFLRITPASINKFQQFLHSLVLKNAATLAVDLPGIPYEANQEIVRIMTQKLDLC